MQVKMRDSLTCRSTDVHPDVVSRRCELLVQDTAHLLNSSEHFGLLFARNIEPVGDMAARNDEDVARRDRIGIPDCFDQSAFVQYTITGDCAERTRFICHFSGSNRSTGLFRDRDNVRQFAAGDYSLNLETNRWLTPIGSRS